MISENNINKCRFKRKCQIIGGILFAICGLSVLGVGVSSAVMGDRLSAAVLIIMFCVYEFFAYILLLLAAKNGKVLKCKKELCKSDNKQKRVKKDEIDIFDIK